MVGASHTRPCRADSTAGILLGTKSAPTSLKGADRLRREHFPSDVSQWDIKCPTYIGMGRTTELRSSGAGPLRPRSRRRESLARGGDSSPARASLPATSSVFRQEGEYWTIVYAGRTVRVRDALGLHYLVRLLGNPHERFSAADLVATVKGDGAVDPERARSAVSKRIRSAIDRITQHHPGLGYHLSTTIRTGHECVYHAHPEQPLVWTT